MSEAPYLMEKRVVAASPAGAPEYELRAVLRREFDADSPAIWLVVEGPLGAEVEYWDSHHVELMIDLLRRALPALRQSEQHIEGEWEAWVDRVGAPRRATEEAG